MHKLHGHVALYQSATHLVATIVIRNRFQRLDLESRGGLLNPLDRLTTQRQALARIHARGRRDRHATSGDIQHARGAEDDDRLVVSVDHGRGHLTTPRQSHILSPIIMGLWTLLAGMSVRRHEMTPAKWNETLFLSSSASTPRELKHGPEG